MGPEDLEGDPEPGEQRPRWNRGDQRSRWIETTLEGTSSRRSDLNTSLLQDGAKRPSFPSVIWALICPSC